MQIANSPVYQPRPAHSAEDIAQRLRVNRHERWVNSKHYAYVMSIIEEWKKSIGDPNQFSEEALISATDKEIKDKLLLCKRCEKEAENLKTLLS